MKKLPVAKVITDTIWRTSNPSEIVCRAARQTMARVPKTDTITNDKKLVQFLYRADHRSPLEHVVLSMQVTGVSRAFMAQITRHRLASYTCSSQHYQDYRDYPIAEATPQFSDVHAQLYDSMCMYSELIDNGMAKDEARFVLPEAMSVNMIITANAREWATIMHYRLCHRNTTETLMVAEHMRKELMDWFPDLFSIVGPECEEGYCKQGPMKCNKDGVK